MICLLSRSTNALRVNTGHVPCHEEYVVVVGRAAMSEFMNGYPVLRFIVAQYDSADDENRIEGRFTLR